MRPTVRWLRPPSPQVTSRLLVGLAPVILAAAAVAAVPHLGGLSPVDRLACVIYFVTILIAEFVRVSLPGERELAPMSIACSFGLLTTIDVLREPVSFGAGVSILVVSAAMGLAWVVRGLFGHVDRVEDSSARFIAVAVAAVVFRALPVTGVEGAPTLLLLCQRSDLPRWAVGIAMLLACAVGLAVHSVIIGVVILAREHGSFARTLADEVRAGAGLNVATSTTGTLISLAEGSLGPLAIPLFVFPLALTQFAVRRQADVLRVRGETTSVLSELTDRAGYTPAGHAGRVAALCAAVARELRVPERAITTLVYAAQMHDLGQVTLRDPIPAGATVMAAPADQDRIAAAGADIVELGTGLEDVGRVLRSQAKPYRQVRELGEQLPLASRILKVANAFDDLLAGSANNVDAALERINLGLGYEYDPRVVDALTSVVARNPALAGRRVWRTTAPGVVTHGLQ